ncbi:MAG TPA: hypothetical protein VG389_13980 [Myxococcota bacterium]|nr:hypothetical protein [Myxococcota bacterium]
MSAHAEALADLQKIAVKVPLSWPAGDAPRRAAVDAFIPILAAWRDEAPADYVDVADNAHLSSGLVVQLVGRRFTVGLDLDAPAGFAYLHKRGLEGTPAERVRAVMRAALTLAMRLLRDPACPPELAPAGDVLWVGVNDRVAFPVPEAAEALLADPFGALADLLYGAGAWRREREADPRARFGWWLRPVPPRIPPAPLDALLARL